MSRIARLTPDGTAIAEYPLDTSQLGRLVPTHSFGREPSDEQLAAHGFARVQDVPPPAVEFGDTVVEGMPENAGGAWRQTWITQGITLVEAKTRLRRMAAEVFQDKVTSPNPNQLISLGYIGAIQARNDRFKPDLDDVVARIASATTIRQAREILAELEAAT